MHYFNKNSFATALERYFCEFDIPHRRFESIRGTSQVIEVSSGAAPLYDVRIRVSGSSSTLSRPSFFDGYYHAEILVSIPNSSWRRVYLERFGVLTPQVLEALLEITIGAMHALQDAYCAIHVF